MAPPPSCSGSADDGPAVREALVAPARAQLRHTEIDQRRELGYAPTDGDLEAMLATTHAWYVASGQLAPPPMPGRTA